MLMIYNKFSDVNASKMLNFIEKYNNGGEIKYYHKININLRKCYYDG